MCWIRGFTGPKIRFTRISFIWGPQHLIQKWNRVRKARECKQSLATPKADRRSPLLIWEAPATKTFGLRAPFSGTENFSFNVLTIFVGRHWRQNSTTVEQVARFQRLFPNPSWLMSGRKNIQFQYLFIWNQIFQGIKNCLMGTKC